MPLSDQFGRIPLGLVIVRREERQRGEINTDDLDGSIRRRGVLNPIIIDRDFVLIAGERRLESSRKLGLPDIPYRFADELAPSEREIIELEENIKRKDLAWQDIVKATQRIHQLYTQIDPDWTQEKTAEELSLAQGTISVYLKVASSIGEERIAGAATVREAHNFLDRREQRVNAEALEELFGAPSPESAPPTYSHPALLNGGPPLAVPRVEAGPPPAGQTILNADFIAWAKDYSGPKFNLLHCDFPYGIPWGPQMHGAYERGTSSRSEGHQHLYDDSPDIFNRLLETMFESLDRIASQSAHLMFWYSADSLGIADLIRLFGQKAPSWQFCKFPLIWFKSDNSGIASDATRWPRHTYEACLLAMRGDRKIVQIIADSYSAPTDTSLHPSTKPEPVLRHFFRMLVDSTTRLLDPTCGSGTSIRAAESLGAKAVLGLELSPQIAEAAQGELRTSRLKRMAEQVVKKAPTVAPV